MQRPSPIQPTTYRPRPTTSASVPWSPIGWTKGASGVDQRTPNLRLVIQEIVNRPGWSGGNSLALIVTGSGKRVAESYNGESDEAPLLHIEYSTDGEPPSPPTQYTLTVSENGTGSGTVTSSPAGIDCGSDCSEDYDENTQVTLTATPDTNSSFTGWTGACTNASGTCTVTMNAAKSVTATFNTSAVTAATPLTVNKAGSGGGTVTSSPSGIDCGSDCSEAYDKNTIVTLTASANADSTFTGWSGDCSGTGSCTVTMDSAKSVTATFDQTPSTQYTLSVTKNGSGSGTVTSSPAGINCGSDCSEDYDENTVVDLTASAGPGSSFAGWSGDCSGTGSCTVTVDSAKSVTATFNQVPTGGGGSITSLTQVNHFKMGWTGGTASGTPMTIPSTDAAGIVYHPTLGPPVYRGLGNQRNQLGLQRRGRQHFRDFSNRGYPLQHLRYHTQLRKGRTRSPPASPTAPRASLTDIPTATSTSHTTTPLRGSGSTSCPVATSTGRTRSRTPKGRDDNLGDHDDPRRRHLRPEFRASFT